ncbi:proteophosphoglycan ppg4 [Lichtheimia corymbifera JMRC:FSU:9682]|uniref:Proteophosphoglycan ppg4 n=1 Tax=Lichtheimia corymbifera JMRC:FSU:9682 TaxID=1263082 RepID=A0A068S042_9FUNG|nr:proteophosphoglycan ppg4 [Lichtheimia corymbifera JMRC:FSU:9682]
MMILSTAPNNKRVGGGGSTVADGILFKYKLAKGLTIASMILIIIMAIHTLVSPMPRWFHNNLSDDNYLNDGRCELPSELFIVSSEDGTYTPPNPDATLLEAIHHATYNDIDSYCRNIYSPTKGFSDATIYNTHGECGNWQQRYQQLHQERLEQFELIKQGKIDAVKEPPQFVSYLCREVPVKGNRGCGGLADRMNGMISTFFYALLTDRAYLAHWADANPIPLEVLFERPNIDWSYDPKEMKELFNQPDKGLTHQDVDTLNQKYPVLGQTLFPNGPTQDFHELWNGTFVEIRSNRGYIVRTFKESSLYPDILSTMGLHKENTFGCLTDFLFRPTIGSRRFINAYRGLFQMDSILSIGMQIRTDDNAMANPQWDSNSLEQWDYFLTCANQLASVKRQPHHKRVVYFLITDSVRLRDEFASINSNSTLAEMYLGQYHNETSTVITGLPIQHIEPDQVEKYIHVEHHVEVTIERMTPGVNSAVIENWLLANTDYRIISPQGYGKLAAFHSNSDNSTISLPRYTRKQDTPDCTSPDAMVTYDWLATQWSLG